MGDIYQDKREYFDAGSTKSFEFRIGNLKKLKNIIQNNEEEILSALYKDLHKSKFEAYTSEIGILYEEINYAIKNLKKWMRVKKVSTGIINQPSKTYIYSEPLGVVLILGPWNYPFQLIFAPLIGAIAAGNCAVIKPSNEAKHVSALIAKLISDTFPEEYISTAVGPGRVIGPDLINKYRFDHIFFTGSLKVGKIIEEMAAKSLTPVTLELGGKSPVIVAEDADIDLSSKSIAWAKYYNSGQTCVCPDYLLIHKSVKDEFLKKIKKYITDFYGISPENSESYGRIINEKRFDILSGYLKKGSIIAGGRTNKDKLYIEPTVIDNVSFDDSIMKEEIFGPIFPVITYENIQDVIPIIRRNRYPLALYIYTNDNKTEDFIIENVEFGGGCVNNSIIHLLNPKVPFGGVGFSGRGMYHGKYSFDTFTHKKTIVKTSPFFNPPLKYPPYNDMKLKIAKKYFGR